MMETWSGKVPMPERSFRILLWTLALTGVLLDQGSKYTVFAWLRDARDGSWTLFQNERGQGFHLIAQYESNGDGSRRLDAHGHAIPHVNHGALFGFLRDYKVAANSGFAIISLLAALAIMAWSTQRTTAADPWLCAALGLILAGTMGNFYDRLIFGGVRDFLHWNYGFDWPVFNLADCCLVLGASLLLIQAFTAPSHQEHGGPNKQPATLVKI
jgi:lipoprotein signal peptidase